MLPVPGLFLVVNICYGCPCSVLRQGPLGLHWLLLVVGARWLPLHPAVSTPAPAAWDGRGPIYLPAGRAGKKSPCIEFYCGTLEPHPCRRKFQRADRDELQIYIRCTATVCQCQWHSGTLANGCENGVASIPWPNQHGRSAHAMSHWAVNLGFPKEPGTLPHWPGRLRGPRESVSQTQSGRGALGGTWSHLPMLDRSPSRSPH
jgi:hypothetical protein